MPPRKRAGPIELALKEVLAELDEGADERVPGHLVYAAVAQKLARQLDNAGPEWLASAAVAREMREQVKAMTTRGEGGDGNPRTADLLARLQAPLGHTSN